MALHNEWKRARNIPRDLTPEERANQERNRAYILEQQRRAWNKYQEKIRDSGLKLVDRRFRG